MMAYLKDIVIGTEMAQGDEMIRRHSKAANDNLWQGSYSGYHSIYAAIYDISQDA